MRQVALATIMNRAYFHVASEDEELRDAGVEYLVDSIIIKKIIT